MVLKVHLCSLCFCVSPQQNQAVYQCFSHKATSDHMDYFIPSSIDFKDFYCNSYNCSWFGPLSCHKWIL